MYSIANLKKRSEISQPTVNQLPLAASPDSHSPPTESSKHISRRTQTVQVRWSQGTPQWEAFLQDLKVPGWRYVNGRDWGKFEGSNKDPIRTLAAALAQAGFSQGSTPWGEVSFTVSGLPRSEKSSHSSGAAPPPYQALPRPGGSSAGSEPPPPYTE